MGWFEYQIEEREREDDRRLQEALRQISDAITGKTSADDADLSAQAHTALAAVLGYYGAKLPGKIELDHNKTFNEALDDVLRPTGVIARGVRLTPGWQHEAVGAMLGFTQDNTPVALLPRARGGYTLVSPQTGARQKFGSKEAAALKEEAFCFYRPLPARALTVRDLALYTLRSLDKSDYIAVIAATLVSTLLGMVAPVVNQIVFGPVIESGTTSVLFPITSLLMGITLSQLLLGTARSLVMSRISTKLDLPLQAAIMMRVLSLPASFFADQQTGDLASRIGSISSIAQIIQNMVLSTALSTVFSLVYILQIARIAPALVVPALAVVIATTALSIVVIVVQQKLTVEQLKLSSELSGWQYSLITGIQKVKLSGAESRAFSKWAASYSRLAQLTYNGPALLRLSSVLSTAITLAGTVAIYASAIAGGVSVAEYMAFTTAFGMVSGAFSTLTGTAAQLAQIKPHLELAGPVLDATPESSEGKQQAGRLSGGFELENVTFAYREGQAPVLSNLSLKVKPGSYVAIVGKTGCGKSTLMRLLLGFETPQRGAVRYDGRDLTRLDVQSVRQNIGVVLQDGKLFSGSIFDNIAISAPGLTQDEAWHAAELAGIADDIRAMPMGMHTLITEGGGGVSGGQRQRLMIARAVAGNPRILMFDEATSALDNITQKKVSDSLDGLKCTRLVIAHRLSTIKHCDRIVLIDNGHIAEDGTYDELMAAGGQFAELVARQQA